MADKERNLRFAEAVERAIAGLTQREVRRRTGISATYVGDMLWGTVPSFRKLEQLARGLELRGAKARALFEAAGYAVPADLAAPGETLREGIAASAQRHGLVLVFTEFRGADPEEVFEDPSEVQETLDALDQRIARVAENEPAPLAIKTFSLVVTQYDSGKQVEIVVGLMSGRAMRLEYQNDPAPTSTVGERRTTYQTPRDHYHQRLGELLDLCAELEVEPMLADFYGGEAGQVQTHEDADRVADALVRDQIRSYPEHAERFRALLRGEG